MRLDSHVTGLLLFFCAFAAGAVPPEKLPAFPGAEGFGAFTPGGRGGKVIPVTNLNDSGPGSLRAACEADGPRIVVFRVGGIIELKDDLEIRKPFITIAGQTAPGGGICLKNFPLEIKETHDVIVRHLRVRPGDVMGKELDGLSVGNVSNLIIDHCSVSWGIDETLSVTGDSKDVTVQWCIISESLNNSVHKKGKHGYGSLIISKDGGYSFHHNIYAHHNSRSPRPGSPTEAVTGGILLDFRNNVIYNWGMRAGYSSESLVRMNYVGNYLKTGPSTQEKARAIAFLVGGPNTRLYLAENRLEGNTEKSANNFLLLAPAEKMTADRIPACVVAEAFPVASVKTDPASTAYEKTLDGAGATLPVRDAVDARIVESIRTGGGRIIDSQREVGGWPEYQAGVVPEDTDQDGMPDAWEQQYALDPANAADTSQDADDDGYTNIEEFLNGASPRKTENP